MPPPSPLAPRGARRPGRAAQGILVLALPCACLLAAWCQERAGEDSSARAPGQLFAVPGLQSPGPGPAGGSQASATRTAAARTVFAWPTGDGRQQGRVPDIISRQAAEAAAGPGPDEWLKCDLEFSPEARKVKGAELEASMADAVQDQNFRQAQLIKDQIEALSNAGPVPGGAPEKWIMQAREFGAFSRFLNTRNIAPGDVKIDCEENGPAAFGGERCKDCSKLNFGGTLGVSGVVTPAYPPQEAASGCLGLTSALNVETDPNAYITDDSFDASSVPRASAFCRVA